MTETVPADQPIWLVSDLHLGDGTPSDAFFGKDRHLMALLRRVQREGAMLVIAGDALDVQQAWTLTRILRAHQDLLGAMSSLARDGRLIYIVGNHDQDLSLYRDLLHFRVCDALHVGDQALVTHGHENDPFIGVHLEGSDLPTRMHHLTERYLDTWLRLPLGEFYNVPNRLMFWVAHKVGLANLFVRSVLERFDIQGFGQRQLDTLDYWARSNMGDPMCMIPTAMNRLADGPWKWMVAGHSHLPGVVHHPLRPDRAYVNLGSWTFGSSQYATWDGQRFEVKDWMSGRTYGDELYQAALSGEIDEKDFWQWWREQYMGWFRFREGEERRGTLRGWEAYVRDRQQLAQIPDPDWPDWPALPAPPRLPESRPVDREPEPLPRPADRAADPPG